MNIKHIVLFCIGVFLAVAIGISAYALGTSNAGNIQTAQDTGAQVGFSSTPEPKTDLKIKGNKNSKIYHLPGCASYDRISEKNIVWFKTKEEAEAAGYRMAKNC